MEGLVIILDLEKYGLRHLWKPGECFPVCSFGLGHNILTVSYDVLRGVDTAVERGIYFNTQNVFPLYSDIFVCLLSIKFTFITVTYL